jgi:hypothetical protein
VPNGYRDGVPVGISAFPPNRLYELSLGYLTGERVMGMSPGDAGNRQPNARSAG